MKDYNHSLKFYALLFFLACTFAVGYSHGDARTYYQEQKETKLFQKTNSDNEHQADCFFNLLEFLYPEILSPVPQPTQQTGAMFYRYYSDTNAEIRIDRGEFFFGQPDDLQNLGVVDFWLHFVKAEILFNWLEPLFPELFNPLPQFTKVQDGAIYRHYPGTDVIIATFEEDLYFFDQNSQLYNLGKVDCWLAAMNQGLCFQLLIELEGEGSVTPDEGQHCYCRNAVVELSASPASGWAFEKWEGEVQDPARPESSIVMQNNQAVTAKFVRIKEPEPDVPDYLLVDFTTIASSTGPGYFDSARFRSQVPIYPVRYDEGITFYEGRSDLIVDQIQISYGDCLITNIRPVNSELFLEVSISETDVVAFHGIPPEKTTPGAKYTLNCGGVSIDLESVAWSAFNSNYVINQPEMGIREWELKPRPWIRHSDWLARHEEIRSLIFSGSLENRSDTSILIKWE